MKKRTIIHTLIYFLIVFIETLPFIILSSIKYDAAGIGIIGGADGPTFVFLLGRFFIPTTILSCILLLLSFIIIFKESKKLKIAIIIISVLTMLTSLFSISKLTSLVSIICPMIIILLTIQILLYWKEIKQASNNPDFQV